MAKQRKSGKKTKAKKRAKAGRATTRSMGGAESILKTTSPSAALALQERILRTYQAVQRSSAD